MYMQTPIPPPWGDASQKQGEGEKTNFLSIMYQAIVPWTFQITLEAWDSLVRGVSSNQTYFVF